MAPKIPPQKIEDCKRIYLKHKGKNHGLIEKEMRELGYTTFSTRCLTHTRSRFYFREGWVKRFGWDKLLDPKQWLKIEMRRIRHGFPAFLKVSMPDWKWAWDYQELIYAALDRIVTGRSTRLMIFLPPRHGKSELVTIRYSAWRIEIDPTLRIIIGSYNQKLANRFSRRTREIVRERSAGQKSNRSRRPPAAIALNKQKTAADEWETTAGGGVKAVGAGAGVTGFGANLIIIDDPIKGRAEAESKNNRERVWDWFNDDIHTRLEPGGAIILIQTRWHEDDLAGRLQKEMKDGGEHWDIVSLPALAEENDPLGRSEGDALCPSRFSRQALLGTRRRLGTYSFSSLFQQQPVPAGGAVFKREWFSRIVDHAPEGLRWCRGYDLAVSTKTSADYTASFRCALDRKTGDLYIADGFRKRIEFPDQRRYIVERIREEKNTEHGIEEALHGQAFVQELWRETSLSRFAFRGVRVAGDKLTRSLSWANRAEAGKVVLVRGTWIDEFIEEVCQFPNAKHDDQVDAVSLAVNMIETRKYGTLGC